MKWIGTSWKMNKLRAEARDYAREYLELVRDVDLAQIQPFVLPPVTSLGAVLEVLRERTNVMLGVQNAHWAESGPYTGEISMAMAADAGAEIVEIGHAERRQLFGETDQSVNRKVRSALRSGLTPLLCVGEPSDAFAEGRSREFVLGQLRAALDGVRDLSSVLVAYEPIWAIGTSGRAPDPAEVAPVMECLQEAVGSGQSVPGRRAGAVLYGGSVHTGNAPGLLALSSVDGLFVGRAAWRAEGFVEILRCATRCAAAARRRP